MRKRGRGLTVATLAMLGTGAIAYGVTRSFSNRNNNQKNQKAKGSYVPDYSEIIQ